MCADLEAYNLRCYASYRIDNVRDMRCAVSLGTEAVEGRGIIWKASLIFQWHLQLWTRFLRNTPVAKRNLLAAEQNMMRLLIFELIPRIPQVLTNLLSTPREKKYSTSGAMSICKLLVGRRH